MANITKPFDFTNGTTADAEQVDQNFDTLYAELNGKLDDDNFANITLNQADATARTTAWLTGKPGAILSRLATQLKAILGTANIYDAVPATLKDLSPYAVTRFQFSSNWGRDSTMSPNSLQSFIGYAPVIVPASKKLVIKKVRWSVFGAPPLKLVIQCTGVTNFETTTKGESDPNYVLFTNSTASPVAKDITISLKNEQATDQTIRPTDFVWVEFTFED